MKTPKPPRGVARGAPTTEISMGGLAKLGSARERRRDAMAGLRAIGDRPSLYAMPHAEGGTTVYRIGRAGRVHWEWTHREMVDQLDPIDPGWRHLIEYLFVQLQDEGVRREWALEIANASLRGVRAFVDEAKKHNAEQKSNALLRWAKIQREYEDMRRESPGLTIDDASKLLSQERRRGGQESIRKHLKKPAK